MSSQLTQLVPIFDSSNWSTWSKAMTAFFMLQGLWGFVDGSIASPGATGTATELAAWQRSDEMARGNLTLRLSPAIQQAITGTSTQTLWDAVKARYGAVSMPSIYRDF